MKPPFSVPRREPKHCLLYSLAPGQNCSCKNALWVDRTLSRPRVEFLRADRRIRVLEIIYLKIWKSPKTWDHSWQPKKRKEKKQNWPLCSQCAKPCPAFQELGWSLQEEISHREMFQRRKGKENLFDPLPPACTDVHRRWSRRWFWSKKISLSRNSSGERRVGKNEMNREVEVICGFQVSVSLLFLFIVSNH